MVYQVVKAPKEAPHLQDKEGIFMGKCGGFILLKIGDKFTYFRESQVKRVNKKRRKK